MPEGSAKADRERRAFEMYFSLPKRSYKTVAAHLGVSLATIKAWSRTHRWKTRLAEREAEAARQMADQSSRRGQEENQRHLKIVRVALMFLTRSIAEGNLKQLSELDRLIRLEEHLLGIPAAEEIAAAYRGQAVVILPDDGSGGETYFALMPPKEVTIPHAEA